MRTMVLTFTLISAALTAAEDPPEADFVAAVEALRAGDARALIRVAVDGDRLATWRESWNRIRSQEDDPQRDALLDAQLAMIAAPNAGEILWTQLRGRIAEFDPRDWQDRLGDFAKVLEILTTTNDQVRELDEARTLRELLDPLAAWLPEAGLDDPDKARAALEAALSGFRRLEITSAADLRALEFDHLVDRGDVVLETLKEVAACYDLDLDAFLASAAIEKVEEIEGERVVTVGFDCFDRRFTTRTRFHRDEQGDWAWQLPAKIRALVEDFVAAQEKMAENLPDPASSM